MSSPPLMAMSFSDLAETLDEVGCPAAFIEISLHVSCAWSDNTKKFLELEIPDLEILEGHGSLHQIAIPNLN